jgi:pilus assembly protein CpaF
VPLKDRVARSAQRDEELDDGGEIARYRRKLLKEIDLGELSSLNPTQRRARIERMAGQLLDRESPFRSTTERTAILRQIVDESLGLGVLEPLLADESITEIMVNGPGDVWVERGGCLEKVKAVFAGEAQLYQTIDRIVSTVNRRVDESSPMVDARLPTGERVNVIVPPLALTGPTVTIRRFPRPYTLEELIDIGTLDEPMSLLLAALIRAKFNLVISGGTGTGKTTMLNALSAFIPDGERIVTIEDAAELSLLQDHVVSLEARPPNVEGKGQVTIRDLVRNSLRMRPDRILVGEVRGGETLDMLQAMNTGHEGSLATVHANSTDDAIMRLETLATMSELDVPFDALRDQINSAVDVMVHLVRSVDGARRVAEVAAIASRRREGFRLVTLADFEADPLSADRRTAGKFRHFPVPDGLADRLIMRGESVPAAFSRAKGAKRAPEREVH